MIGWGDYLGTGRIADRDKIFLSYEKAKKYIKKFNLKNNNEWKIFSRSNKRPSNIPSTPNNVYKNKGWKDWPDFLSSGRILTKHINYYKYNEAKKIVKNLNIKSDQILGKPEEKINFQKKYQPNLTNFIKAKDGKIGEFF